MRYDITNIAIEDYLTDLMPPRIEALSAMEGRAKQRGLSLVGPVQGQLLYLLASTMNARHILEVGITTGYAALWLSMALAATDGHLTGVERQPDRCKMAREVLDQSGFGSRATLLEGAWFDILPTLNSTFDLIFLDILRSASSKDQATQALEMCIPLLRPGGLLVGDNVLCSAQVLEEDAPPLVQGIQRFNRTIMNHPQLESVIIPLRDGISISRKRIS